MILHINMKLLLLYEIFDSIIIVPFTRCFLEVPFSGDNLYRFHMLKYIIHFQYSCDK